MKVVFYKFIAFLFVVNHNMVSLFVGDYRLHTNTVIPWAWKNIKTAFNGIVKAIKELLKTTKSAIEDIGDGVIR